MSARIRCLGGALALFAGCATISHPPALGDDAGGNNGGTSSGASGGTSGTSGTSGGSSGASGSSGANGDGGADVDATFNPFVNAWTTCKFEAVLTFTTPTGRGATHYPAADGSDTITATSASGITGDVTVVGIAPTCESTYTIDATRTHATIDPGQAPCPLKDGANLDVTLTVDAAGYLDAKTPALTGSLSGSFAGTVGTDAGPVAAAGTWTESIHCDP